jgi:hypothetical protein
MRTEGRKGNEVRVPNQDAFTKALDDMVLGTNVIQPTVSTD